MDIVPITRSPFCVMPAHALFATTNGPKAIGNRGSRREPPGRCPCSRRQRSQVQLKALANMPSNSIGTMATSWEFIPGSFCGMSARARNVRQRARPQRQDKERFPIADFQFPIEMPWVFNWKLAIGNRKSEIHV
jgi:hypothetical protein